MRKTLATILASLIVAGSLIAPVGAASADDHPAGWLPPCDQVPAGTSCAPEPCVDVAGHTPCPIPDYCATTRVAAQKAIGARDTRIARQRHTIRHQRAVIKRLRAKLARLQ